MRRSLILVIAVVLAAVFVASAAATVRVTKRPGRVSPGDKASVTVVVTPKALAASFRETVGRKPD